MYIPNLKTLMLLTAFLFLSFFSVSCAQKALGDFQILPLPQQMEITGVSKLSPQNIPDEIDIHTEVSFIQLEIDTHLTLKPEGYALSITNNTIKIIGKDEPGLLYGIMTLQQIKKDAIDQKVNLPKCEILDFPELSYRAIHVDVKHHLEKMDYYYEMMDRLASYKINAVILEIEDKLQYKRRPLIGSEDAYSTEEWKKLSEYALSKNIKISPLVQGLGHASFILKHEKYKHLRDDPNSDWAFNPLLKKTYELQNDLYLDAFEAFPHGKYIHVGGDEVHTTGKQDRLSALELQQEWLGKVCNMAEAHGRTPIFWDDMPLKHAKVYNPMFDRNISEEKVDKIWEDNEHRLVEFIDQFPKNCVYMRWNYSTPETYGNAKAMNWFSNNGFQVMGATAGQTRWSLMPQNQSNIENIRSFALQSIDSKLDRILLTLWDDDSPHFELYWRGIMAFAEYTWAGDKRSVDEVKKVFRHRMYGSQFYENNYAFIDDLELAVGFWKNALLKKGYQRNNLRRLDNPINEAIIDLPTVRTKHEWRENNSSRLNKNRQYLESVERIAEKITAIKANTTGNHFSIEMYEQVVRAVHFSLSILAELDAFSRDRSLIPLKDKMAHKKKDFLSMRKTLEEVYSKTRILSKPDNYILDQDHHTHNANQSLNFDWQFYPEMLFIEKIKSL